MQSGLYDATLTYEENCEKGPPVASSSLTPPTRTIKKKYRHLGFDVTLPFGIAPGPLPNSKFMKAAFEWGFDVSTYKTVRADTFPCHPFPNVLPVAINGPELHPDKTPRVTVQEAFSADPKTFNITNSFGVPSREPALWQDDVKKAMTYEGDGQLLILSFMGTVRENQTQDAFITDFTKAAGLSKNTGAKVLEANLSCPNIGNEGLVCYNLEVTERVCASIRAAIGNTPLILKIGYYKNEADLERFAEIANKYAQGIAAINTLQVEVVDDQGHQALPGKNRLRSGICGASIKWAGLEMTSKLHELRKKHNYTYEITGVGGVMTPDDYLEYRKAGADCVQTATAAMWNPYLAHEIWEKTSEK